jgi:hypothetical protein
MYFFAGANTFTALKKQAKLRFISNQFFAYLKSLNQTNYSTDEKKFFVATVHFEADHFSSNGC